MEECERLEKQAAGRSKVIQKDWRKILTYNPESHEPWNLKNKRNMEEAIKVVGKWKPKILELEPSSWDQMEAAVRLGEAQQRHVRTR